VDGRASILRSLHRCFRVDINLCPAAPTGVLKGWPRSSGFKHERAAGDRAQASSAWQHLTFAAFQFKARQLAVDGRARMRSDLEANWRRTWRHGLHAGIASCSRLPSRRLVGCTRELRRPGTERVLAASTPPDKGRMAAALLGYRPSLGWESSSMGQNWKRLAAAAHSRQAALLLAGRWQAGSGWKWMAPERLAAGSCCW